MCKTYRIIWANAHEAIRWGNAKGEPKRPCGVAYLKGKGWKVYDLTQGCPKGGVPEFICFGLGLLPVPLSDAGKIIINQMLERAKA